MAVCGICFILEAITKLCLFSELVTELCLLAPKRTELCLFVILTRSCVSELSDVTELCLSCFFARSCVFRQDTTPCFVQEHGVVSHDFGGGSSLSV